jgi:hypothetical protein
MRIEVTQEDINNGYRWRYSSTCCPLGLALRRATGKCIPIWHYQLPKEAMSFFSRIMNGAKCSPCVFEIPEELRFPISEK